MRIALEIGVGAAAALLMISFAVVVARGARERLLVSVAALVGAMAVAAAAGLAISLIRADGDWRIHTVGLVALTTFALGETGLVLLNRLRGRDMRLMGLVEQAFRHVDERIESHAQQRARELEHTLARERARSQHLLIDQERKLAEARQAAITAAEQTASDDLLRRIDTAQAELVARITGWSTDLTRAQDEHARRIEDHGRTQRTELSAQRTQLDEHEAALRELSTLHEHRVEEVKTEFAELLSELGKGLHHELEIDEQHFRREIAQLTERLKAVSQALREDAYREELDARTRLAADIGEAERRVVASFERSLERAADRVAETAERRFDEQIRESREETANRLTSELQRTRDAYARQIEDEIEGRMQEVATQTTQRLQRQLDQVVRQAESQTSSTEDRITFITQRLEAAMDTAAGRVAAFESELELELTTKLTEFERAVRHAEQSVGRETG